MASKISRTRALAIISVICCFGILAVYFSNQLRKESLPIIEKAADFDLVNQDNKKISLAKLSGKAKVMSFMYTSCIMAKMCPLTTRKFKKLQGLLDSNIDQETVFLLVSFDPEKDKPGVLKKYGELYGVDFHNLHFLTGDKASLDKVSDDYQIIAEKQKGGNYRHSVITFLIDKKNNVRRMYIGNEWDPEDLAIDLTTLLGEKS